jgi:hypothetical protein
VVNTWKWSGWRAGGVRGLDLVRVAWAPGDGRESKRFVLAGYVIKNCVLVVGLTGVLGARPTGGLYVCKYAPERKIIVILKGAVFDVDFLRSYNFDCNS